MENRLTNHNVFPALFVLALATAAVVWFEQLPEFISENLVWMPYALGLVITTLALQFNRRHLVVVVMTMTISYWLFMQYLQQPLQQPPAQLSYAFLCMFIPITLLLNMLLPDLGNKHPLSWLLFAVVLAQFAFAVYLAESSPAYWIELANAWLPTRQIDNIVISLNALALCFICLTAAFAWFMWKPTTVSIGLFFSFVAAIFPLVFIDINAISSIFCSAAMAIALLSGFSASHELAYRDQLTGLLGRRMLIEKLTVLSKNYTLAMVDIDHFKSFNDTHGHDVGDDVLAMVASKLTKVGAGGQVFRYGGEEFTVLFKGKSLSQCHEALDDVRELIETTPFAIRDKSKREAQDKTHRDKKNTPSNTVQVTVSIGFAEKQKQHDGYEDVLKSADKALYKAKEGGRNQVVSA